MDITAINGSVQSAAPSREEMKLQEACDGVEGMFLKTLLKEGMRGMLDSAEGHSASALSYALEQTAEEIANNTDTGVSDNIYEQLSANM